MKKYEDNRKYSVRKTLRVTPAQWQMIQERMARVIDDRKEIKEMTYEINKIGTNINQIAYKLNSTGTVSKEDVDEIKFLMTSVWEVQRQLLTQDDYCTKYLRSSE